MTETAHAVVGAAIVTRIPDLRISLPLALASHFLGDLPQHWDVGENWRQKGLRKVFVESLADMAISYLAVFLIFVLWLRADPTSIFLGAFVSELPDYLEGPYFLLQWRTAPWKWINDFQMLFHKKLPQFNLTLPGQIVLSLLFILIAAWR